MFKVSVASGMRTKREAAIPVPLLGACDPERLARLAADSAFLARSARPPPLPPAAGNGSFAVIAMPGPSRPSPDGERSALAAPIRAAESSRPPLATAHAIFQ